jgi:hypothetical protein
LRWIDLASGSGALLTGRFKCIRDPE